MHHKGVCILLLSMKNPHQKEKSATITHADFKKCCPESIAVVVIKAQLSLAAIDNLNKMCSQLFCLFATIF